MQLGATAEFESLRAEDPISREPLSAKIAR
jgi:hypothetical protein